MPSHPGLQKLWPAPSPPSEEEAAVSYSCTEYFAESYTTSPELCYIDRATNQPVPPGQRQPQENDISSTALLITDPVRLTGFSGNAKGAPPNTTTGDYNLVIDQIVADGEELYLVISEVVHVGDYDPLQEVWVTLPVPRRLEGAAFKTWVERNFRAVVREVARHILAGKITLTPTLFN